MSEDILSQNAWAHGFDDARLGKDLELGIHNSGQIIFRKN